MIQHQGNNHGTDLAPDIEIIISKFRAPLHFYAKAKLHDEDAVDEVLQQTWLALYLQGIKGGVVWLRSPGIYSWLKSVVHNRIYDYQQQHRTISLDREEVMWVIEQRTDPLEHPDIMNMRDEMVLDFLDSVLLPLTPEDAFIMLCFHYLEYSSKEIANRLCCSENTIKSRLRRAREQLRESLEDRGIRVRDIRQIGGLRERLDQILAWLALDAVPRDEWEGEIVQSILRRKSEHPSWAFIAFEFLEWQDIDIATRYDVCRGLHPARRTLRGVDAPFHKQEETSREKC